MTWFLQKVQKVSCPVHLENTILISNQNENLRKILKQGSISSGTDTPNSTRPEQNPGAELSPSLLAEVHNYCEEPSAPRKGVEHILLSFASSWHSKEVI